MFQELLPDGEIILSNGTLDGLSQMTNVSDFLIEFENGQVHFSVSVFYDVLNASFDYHLEAGWGMVNDHGSTKVSVCDVTAVLHVRVDVLSHNLENVDVHIPEVGRITIDEIKSDSNLNLIQPAINAVMPVLRGYIKFSAEGVIRSSTEKLVTSLKEMRFISYEKLEAMVKDASDYVPDATKTTMKLIYEKLASTISEL
ncbi:hypothetical protein QAD02_016780 [Eretmocerus hayati]|uniref:Uncharacterized protein n=1 Tax=Eretmocerus hayati TaxID=131215 RepID=A0ACC2PC23_9HYME|nr:hypothetical protein QAD02_016780 [Eretmocerus hayati]